MFASQAFDECYAPLVFSSIYSYSDSEWKPIILKNCIIIVMCQYCALWILNTWICYLLVHDSFSGNVCLLLCTLEYIYNLPNCSSASFHQIMLHVVRKLHANNKHLIHLNHHPLSPPFSFSCLAFLLNLMEASTIFSNGILLLTWSIKAILFCAVEHLFLAVWITL